MFLTFGNTLLNNGLNIIKFISNIPLNINSKNYFDMYNPFYTIYGWAFVYFCLGGGLHYISKKNHQNSNKNAM